MGAADEVVASVLEGRIAPPSLEKVDRLVQIELVLKDLSRLLRVIEDADERAPELGLELFDGLLIERRIILVKLRDFLPSGWIRSSLRHGLRRVRPLILLVASETERSSSSSGSSRHG
jgi:hypothetical protein